MACPSTWGLESHWHLGPKKAQQQSGSGKVGFEREDDDRSAIWSTFSILLTGMWVWKLGCPHIDRNSAFKTRSFPRCLKISTSGYVIFNHIKSHDQTLWDPNRDWSFFPFVFVRITLAFRHVKLLYRISNLSSKSSIPTGCWNEVLSYASNTSHTNSGDGNIFQRNSLCLSINRRLQVSFRVTHSLEHET